jgi:hypothetical protein
MTLRMAGSNCRNGGELVPGSFPGGDQAGAFAAVLAAQLLEGSLGGGLVDGGVERAQRGGEFLAVVV